MQRKLSESINSFFTSNRVTVGSLIRDMKANKADVRSLASKLGTGDMMNGSTAPLVTTFSVMNREPLVDLFRDSSFRMSRLFNIMNTSGLMLDSMSNVLTSEIDKIEEDIKNLQLFIDNYEFLAGKDDLYNANYIEKFDNSLNDYTADGYNMRIPDRNNIEFPVGGNAFVDSFTGLMKIGSGQDILNVFDNIKSINVTSNYSNYITTETPFELLFNDTLADAWTTTVKSPTILTSKLTKFDSYIGYDYSYVNGAISVIEVEFNDPIELDTVRFSPNYANGLQLVQLVLIKSTGINQTTFNTADSFTSILQSPLSLDSKTELTFNKAVVKKMMFVFNQSSYTRSKKPSMTSELNSKALNSFVEENMIERRKQFSKTQDIAYWYFLNRYSINNIKKNNSVDNEYYSYRFPQELSRYAKIVEDEIFKISNFNIEDRNPLIDSPLFVDLFKSMMNSLKMDNKFFDEGYYRHNNSNTALGSIDDPGFINSKDSNINNTSMQYYKSNNGLGNVRKTIMAMSINEESDSYEYGFSLRNIEFISTLSNQADRAAFVSKKIPVDGNILGIKAKVSLAGESKLSVFNDFDLNQSVSYELSISNVDNPKNESDWTPLAFNNSPRIESEVAFFDIADYSYKPRFIPKSDSIILFKDGKIVISNKYNYRSSDNIIELIDKAIYSSSSIFCVSYEIDGTLYNPFELDLVKNNSYQTSIKRYYKDNTFGQMFSSTGQNNTVTLDYVPYVNNSFISGASYDSYNGTAFSGENNGYSPVRVRLSDGSYARNLTNYTTIQKNVEFYNSTYTLFIQTGKYIVFNKTISQPFFVEYDYVPYSLRFRFIMRKNIKSIDIPTKADSIVLKMKTTHVDPYYDKLIYISKLQ